jgi:alpha-L-fucosidase
VPQWYQDAKFGIFIHWGVYSVPAFSNEWYPRNMYIEGSPEFEHHRAVWGAHSEFGYKDFVPMFKAGEFDPARWADLFRRAGARYVVPVAEHHDGFAMYDCSFSRWTSIKMGPKRDIVGELAAAVRKEGLVFGVSSHRAEHWWFFNGGMAFDSDVQDPQFHDLYGPAQPSPFLHDQEAWRSKDWQPRPDAKFRKDWLARTCELVDKYHPQLVWFDGWIGQVAFESYLQRFASYYYNRGLEWNEGVAINYKSDAFPEGVAVFDIERGQLRGIRPLFWQTDTAVAKGSWGYVKHQDYKTATSLVHDLVDIVSKNGALLLNIGPRPDGTIPEPEEQILIEFGRCLAVNGEAIYGTRPWKVYGEGPTEVFEGSFQDTKRAGFTPQDVRFTVKDDVLYAIVLGWPESGRAIIESLGTAKALYPETIGLVELLGSEEGVQWSRDDDGLRVKLPPRKPDEAAFVLKIVKE